MELLKLDEVAKRTCTSTGFWRKQVLLRRIAVFKVGRCVRLDAEDVRAFLAVRSRPAIAKGGTNHEDD